MFALIGGVGIGVALGWRAAVARSLLSARCIPVPKADLTVDQIVDLKLRWKAYRRSESEAARFELSPIEAAFLLSGESATSVYLRSEGDRLAANLSVPVQGGCYNVDYYGKVRVEHGVATLEPDRFVIGGTDLTELTSLGGAVGGTTNVITPDDLEDPDLRERFRNIEALEIQGGRVFLRFADPDQVWR